MKLFNFIYIYGMAVMFSMSMSFMVIFVEAYNNDEYKYGIVINNYGEADIEMLLLIIIGLPAVLYSFAVSTYRNRRISRKVDRNG